MSKSHLSEIERGECALDSISEIIALADALQIAPSELIRLPVPAPANGDTDSAVAAVSRNRPGGLVLPVTVLRDRVLATLGAHYGCDPEGKVGATLPALIRDLHTSIAAGRDVAELLDLAVLLHAGATVAWLRVAGASLVTEGNFDLAQAELDAVTVPTNSPESMQLAGTLALCRSVVASADSRPGDVDAPLELAAELAKRTGDSNAYWLGFGPHAVGQWHMFAAREAGDHERVVSIAEALRPDVHADRSRQADYWVNYGRALSRLRGRGEDAVLAFRRAEVISPHHVYRDPFVCDELAVLLAQVRQDSSAGRELHRMAYRAGLPV